MYDDLDELFPNNLNVLAGVKEMVKLWKAAGKDIDIGKEGFSIYFLYDKRRHAFRVETSTQGRTPRLVIYTGAKDPRRGSPLVKGASPENMKKLNETFGMPENKDGKPDWLKGLSQDTPPQFYADFVRHAIDLLRTL